MKRAVFKLTATVLCLVMLFSSMSFAVWAVLTQFDYPFNFNLDFTPEEGKPEPGSETPSGSAETETNINGETDLD